MLPADGDILQRSGTVQQGALPYIDFRGRSAELPRIDKHLRNPAIERERANTNREAPVMDAFHSYTPARIARFHSFIRLR